jgi:pimeloyl-ACP methyl ester carboxylesterase
MDGMTASIAERVVMLGASKSLVGVLTSPAAQTDLPALVLLNMGIIHRVGHHRMYVKLARRLAQRGHTVLRFDFPGIGDSLPEAGEGSQLDVNLRCLGKVIDWLESTQRARSFLLMGLCSGADHAIIYASQDARVVGTVLLDPSIPRTWQYYAVDWMRPFVSLEPWLKLIAGRGRVWSTLYRAVGARPEGVVRAPVPQINLNQPEIVAYLEKVYQGAVDNGARIMAVFTAETLHHNYRSQIRDALSNVSFGERLDLHYFGDADHTFSTAAMRERLFALLERWLDAHLPVPAAGMGRNELSTESSLPRQHSATPASRADAF